MLKDAPLTPFQRNLAEKILKEGSLSFEEVMGLSNAHYYAHANVFGKEGDFITAPEISQIFGELIAVWAFTQIETLKLKDYILVELGPGRGTLMADILRVLGKWGHHPPVHLIEVSPILKNLQKESLQPFSNSIIWHRHLDDLPPSPSLIIANEFFDALPVQAYFKKEDEWKAMNVKFKAREFSFEDIPKESSSIRETSSLSLSYTSQIAKHLKTYGGAAAIIDYGDYTPHNRFGLTVQCVKRHAFTPIFQDLGESDITYHVDFYALSKAFLQEGLDAHFSTQCDFLKAYGFDLRLKRLLEGCAVSQKEDISSRAHRLIDKKQMGELFKVLTVTSLS